MTINQYQYFQQFLQSHTGLTLDEHRLGKIIDIIRQEWGDKPLEQLSQLLAQEDFTHPLWQHFLRVMTIGETYFFRNQAHINALQNHVLPKLIEERRASGFKHLNIWSAGCATGEEPYTLAMLLESLLPDIDSWIITILATDINVDYLEYGRRGVYQKRSFRLETPDYAAQRWFKEEKDGLRINPSIQKRVRFAPLNLIEDAYPSHLNSTTNLDLIVCRNVTIYFSTATTSRVVKQFHEALNPGGYLIVGHSEPQMKVYDAFEVQHSNNTVYYRKSTSYSRQQPANIFTGWQPEVIKASSNGHSAPYVPETPAFDWKQPVLKQKTDAVAEVRLAVPKDMLQPAEENPEESMWSRARDAANQENWEAAQGLLAQLEQKNRFQPQVHYLYGLIHAQLGNEDEALTRLRWAVYCDKAFALAHYMLGDIYAKKLQPAEALRHFNQALDGIAELETETVLPYSDDLTAGMLRELVSFHQKRLSDPQRRR